MLGSDPHAAPVMPGPEIAIAAVLEKGESPVPGMISSDTTSQESTVEIKSAVDLVRLLRRAGLSKVAARAVTANGWKGLQALSTGDPPTDELTALVDAVSALRAKLEE